VHQLRECGTDTEPVLQVAVEAGRVTEAHWPSEQEVHELVTSGSHDLPQ
jgi:hypothetical protein